MENNIHIYEYIVVGLGADGSSALYHLSKSCSNILGLEQFEMNHKNGSSHGDTRIIRQAYFEGEHFIPLAKRAYDLWDEIEEISGEKVFFKVGGLNVSKENFNDDENIVKKCKEACDKFQIKNKIYSSSEEINKDFQYFNFPGEEENYQALFEYEAGYLKAEDCVRINLRLAEKNGANIIYNLKIDKIIFDENLDCYVLNPQLILEKIEHNSQKGFDNDFKSDLKLYAKKIVLSCGSWINTILEKNFMYKLPLSIDLNHVYYFKFLNEKNNIENLENTPIFIIQEDYQNEFYGFPDIKNGNHFKYSLYHQNLTHSSISEIKRGPNQKIYEKIKKFCKKFIKNFNEENVELIKEISCLYTSTPDYDFIIDFLPNNKNRIIVCSACSGHGFKFSSAVGEHIKLLFENKCEPYKEFRLDRFQNCFIK